MCAYTRIGRKMGILWRFPKTRKIKCVYAADRRCVTRGTRVLSFSFRFRLLIIRKQTKLRANFTYLNDLLRQGDDVVPFIHTELK